LFGLQMKQRFKVLNNTLKQTGQKGGPWNRKTPPWPGARLDAQ
jgi:hypothetical protein